MKIHHVGYLVLDIELSKKQFEMLGYIVFKETFRDISRKTDICFMKNGEYIIELICPYEIGSPVDKLIKKIRNAPYHICYVSDCIEQDLEKMKRAGWLQLGEIEAAPAIGDTSRVVFLMNSEVGLIELVEI